MKEDFLSARLHDRQMAGNLRSLPDSRDLCDFVSNDYLGLAANTALWTRIKERYGQLGPYPNGGTGSRLLSGNHRLYQEVEDQLKGVFQAEAVLLFNSGYAANQAVVSSVAEKGDTIIYDQLSHVCLKEGAWLSRAQTVAFRHNDPDDLRMRLQQASGRVFVVTETIFSMDGDVAPLAEIVALCEEFGAYLIIDEAHSTGVAGKDGSGLLVEMGLHQRVFARVYTFGKGMGVHGACVAGSLALRDYLVNFGRPFIYTTSLPPHSVLSIGESFLYLAENMQLQQDLQDKINLFKTHYPKYVSDTAIQPVMIGSNEKARAVSLQLQEQGFDVRPILSPTVQRGKERLRVSLHVYNTEKEIMEIADKILKVI
ncbi:8-amino-7-oxononanoate synthase [Marinoscillum sp. MHG1-6]|uniref:aminotransferase class I/II-fold pyridoxal phosphate-dependent enzyme n=1 Tax=Marinoscillum sp. MHG1-6 TaxID=2959627 RepID=UPI0021579484|nr:8-amino-7-oxononanoate synthase [Marinoscillum sp. MHG1-6]